MLLFTCIGVRVQSIMKITELLGRIQKDGASAIA